jgi:hypothetical protein
VCWDHQSSNSREFGGQKQQLEVSFGSRSRNKFNCLVIADLEVPRSIREGGANKIGNKINLLSEICNP